MFNMILFFLMDVIQLQSGSPAHIQDNPYIAAFMGGVIVVIIIAALIAHRKDRREKSK